METKIINEDELVNSMKELAELNEFLEEIVYLAIKVDDSFLKISQNIASVSEKVNKCIKDNSSSFSVNEKQAERISVKVGVLSCVLQESIKGLGIIKANYDKQRQLNKILLIKQEIAKEKYEVLQEISKKSLKNLKRFESFVMVFCNTKYSTKEMSDNEVMSSQRNQMLLILNQYRLSYYVYKCLCYLLEEYNAWLSGEHNSDLEEPIMLDINHLILNETFYPLTKEEYNNGLCESKAIGLELEDIYSGDPLLTGRTLFLLFDSELLSYYLVRRTDMMFLARNIFSDIFMHSSIKKILSQNDVCSLTVESLKEYVEIEKKGPGITKNYIIGFTLLIVLFVGVIYSGWSDWICSLIILFGGYFIIRKMLKKNKSDKVRFVNALNKVEYDLEDELNRRAGLKPRKRKIDIGSHGHPVIGALIGGIIGLFFGPIGCVVGILVGVSVASGNDSEMISE